MKLRISSKIRTAFQRLDDTLNRLAFYRNLKNEKNANFEQLPLNQKDTCKITAFETPPEPQPS